MKVNITKMNLKRELTPLLLTTGCLMLIQQGPMIFRLRTRSSNALVLVPIIFAIFGPQALLRMDFSVTNPQIKKHEDMNIGIRTDQQSYIPPSSIGSPLSGYLLLQKRTCVLQIYHARI